MAWYHYIRSIVRTVQKGLGCGGKENTGKSSVGFDRADLGQVLSNNRSYTHKKRKYCSVCKLLQQEELERLKTILAQKEKENVLLREK